MPRNVEHTLQSFDRKWVSCNAVEAEKTFLNATPRNGLVIAEKYGVRLMSFAISNNRVELAARLVHNFGVCDEDREGLFVYNAAYEGSFDVLRVFVESGIPTLGARTLYRGGYTPLHAACAGGHLEIVRYLLDKGARLGIINNDGYNPINRASVYGHLEVLCYMFNVGGDVRVSSPDGPSLVEDSTERTRPAILAALLRFGAARSDNFEFLAQLLGYEASYSSQSAMIWIVSAILVEQGALHPTTLIEEDAETVMATAAYNGSSPMIRFLLNDTEVGPTLINRTANDGGLPLSNAATVFPNSTVVRRGCPLGRKVSPVRELLCAGAQVGFPAADCSRPPLVEACGCGNIRIVEDLLRAGANPCSEKGGIAPLFDAAFAGSVECISMLVDHGADPNDKRSNLLPLTGAIRGNSWPAVEALLARGARLDAASPRGVCALADAISFFAEGEPALGRQVFWSETFRRLARKYGCAQRVGDGITALGVAVRSAGVKEIRYLLKAGAGNVDDVDKFGLTALVRSIWAGNDAVSAVLVEAGADCSMQLPEKAVVDGLRGTRPLLVAVLSGNVNFVRFAVLNGGANINDVFCGEGTALWFAVDASHCHFDGDVHEAMLTTLLELGADIDFADRVTGCSVVMHAARSGRHNAVALLARHGADLSRQDSLGDTILHHMSRSVAYQHHETDVFNVLVECGADLRAVNTSGETCLHTAARWQGDLNCWKLLELGIDVDTRDNRGRTPLMLSCIAKSRCRKNCMGYQQNAVEVLVSHGARVDARSDRGLTPLHFAARDGATDVCRFLLLSGANVRDVAYRSGKTALHFAVESGNASTVSFLASRGARLDTRDRKGRSPLYIAAQGGSSELVGVLLDLGAKVGICSAKGKSPLELARRKHDARVVRAFSRACPESAVFEFEQDGLLRTVPRGAEANRLHQGSVHVNDVVVDLCISHSDQATQWV